MLVYKDGITRNIRETDWQRYKELGFIEVEATPKVEDDEELEPQDDEVEATPKNRRNKRGN